MGLIAPSLGPSDQIILSKMGPEIVNLLRKISSQLQVGNTHSKRWFGKDDANCVKTLRISLNRMASVINLKEINIHGTDFLKRDKKNFAAARRPDSGWRNNTENAKGKGFITRSQNQGFNIRLDLKWDTSPDYRTASNYDSKFQILVHELSHLILNTEDYWYTKNKCINRAKSEPDKAIKNADSLAYFVEEFR